MDGWCEGGLGQQRMNRGDRKEWRALVYNIVSRGHFILALCSFGQPSRALVIITWRREGCRYMMRFR